MSNQEKKLELKTIMKQKNKGIPLRLVLIIPFVVQIFTAVGLTGYISLRNGEKAVNDLANQLITKVGLSVNGYLRSYLSTPPQINQVNIDAINAGLLNLKDFEKAGQYFWKQMQTYNVSYISYALANGDFIGAGYLEEGSQIVIEEVSNKTKRKNYTYKVEEEGNRGPVIDVYEYEPLTEPWYPATVQANQPIWTEVYSWNNGRGELGISANQPIYNQQKEIVGVMSVDFLLSGISDFLSEIKLSPSAKILLMERNGLLIASTEKQPFKNIQGNDERERLNIFQSEDPLVQETAKFLQTQFGDFKEIRSEYQAVNFVYKGDRYFIRVTPWQDPYGLDWLVVIILPESDFMGQIEANTRTMILLCLLALGIAILLGLITSRWISQPVELLSQATAGIAQGKLNVRLEIKGINELEELSNSFNLMAEELENSFERLEERVKERTLELEKAKNLADVANRAKSKFLANMSHELRTPLNAILGFSQLMQRDDSIPKQQQENISIINRSGEHLLSLINDVLDLAKIEAGKVTLSESDFNLSSLLNTIEKMLAMKAEAKELELIFDLDKEVPKYIKGDEKKIRQVLINLLGNSLKFTQEGYVILRTKLRKKSGSLVRINFEIEDTGVGISAEEITKIFEAFGQTEAGQKAEQGTGLGLTISRQFIELMGGKISCRSELGKGTTFTFDIQVTLSETEKIEEKKLSHKVIGLEPNQPNYKILVVDDRWENRQILLQLLKPIGFLIKEAKNGQEAIEIWQEWEPHLIWMDMRMPILNGYEATKKIRGYLKGQATIIIALTASTLEEEKSLVLATGCDDFVRKPFLENTIFEKMSQYLGVRYLYENMKTTTKPKITTTKILNPAILAKLPLNWLEELSQASSQLNAQEIFNILADFPPEYLSLAEAIKQKVNDFDFEEILNLCRDAISIQQFSSENRV